MCRYQVIDSMLRVVLIVLLMCALTVLVRKVRKRCGRRDLLARAVAVVIRRLWLISAPLVAVHHGGRGGHRPESLDLALVLRDEVIGVHGGLLVSVPLLAAHRVAHRGGHWRGVPGGLSRYVVVVRTVVLARRLVSVPLLSAH